MTPSYLIMTSSIFFYVKMLLYLSNIVSLQEKIKQSKFLWDKEIYNLVKNLWIYDGAFSMRKKCLNTEFFLVCIFLYLDWMQRFTEQISVFSPNISMVHIEKYTPYFDTFHAIIPLFSPNRGTYGPEKTPYLDIFHGVNLRIQSKYRKYGPEKTHYLDIFHAVFGKCS